MLLTHCAVEPVRQPCIEEHLDEDGHGQQGDDQRLVEDGLALEVNSSTSVASSAPMDQGPMRASAASSAVAPRCQQGADSAWSNSHGIDAASR